MSCNCENKCGCEKYKNTPRNEQDLKLLKNRLSRIIGQLGGIEKMLDDNRYCGDILIQISAVQSALKNVGYIILSEHMKTCMAEQIKQGNNDVVDEAVELIKKLK